jgi:hypothetical protein
LSKSVKRSEKFLKAEQTLPEELRPAFAQLVDEYIFHATAVYGQNWAAYKILAELVRDGWRPSAKPHREVDQKKADNEVFADTCEHCGAGPEEFCAPPTGTRIANRALSRPHAARLKRAGYKLVNGRYERT